MTYNWCLSWQSATHPPRRETLGENMKSMLINVALIAAAVIVAIKVEKRLPG